MGGERSAMSVDVLGPLRVRIGERAVEIGPPMHRTLLARLLVAGGRVVPVDRLVDDLWDGEPPPTANATLQSYVSNLRRALEPERAPRSAPTVLVTRPPGYALAIDPEHVDATRFARLVADGRTRLAGGDPAGAVRALDEALATWRGEPYADIDVESIVLAERRRLTELHHAAVEDRLAAMLELGRHREALAELEALVATAPYRERAWELLVLARYRSGRQVEALRAYQEARRALVEHAGVEPGPALVELERRVVAQDPTLDLPARTPSPDRPAAVSRPPLVGRNDAVAVMRDVLDRLAAGHGGLVLVGGDAGIGKTRLLEEMVEPAATLGIRTVWGRSTDGEGAPGYWPWTQALGALATSTDTAIVADAGPQLAAVLADVPGDAAPDPTEHDPGAQRFAVQRAVLRFLRGACRDRPTMLVLDDVQWADASSLRLLGALTAELTTMPLLIAATYRPVEAVRNGALTEALAQAARHLDVRRIELAGLDRVAVGAHLSAAGVSPSPRLVAEVHDRSGGNPFFVTELTRLIVSQRAGTTPPDGGAAARVPHAVHDVTRQRLARLPEPTTDLLALAAIAGRSNDPTVLAAAAGLDVETVLDRLEPAIDVGMIVLDADRPGALRFSHDLQREAIQEALGPTQRVRLHRRIATALAERAGPPGTAVADRVASQIAHHFAESMPLGTAPEALRWATVAARHATARGADDEAVAAWTLAVRAHELASPDDLPGRYDLLVALADAHRGAWDVTGARDAVDRAVRVAEQLDDPVRVLDAASITSGSSLWNWSPPGEVPWDLVGPMDRALARLDETPTRTRARALGALGVALRYGDDERARRLTDDAIAAAEALGDDGELARALNDAYLARWWWPHLDELERLTDRSLALPGRTSETEAIALMHRMLVRIARGRLDEVAVDMERAAALRAVVRRPDVASQLDLNLSSWAAMRGRAAEARELLERAYRTRYQASSMWAGEWVYHLGRSAIGDLDDVELDAQATELADLAAGETTDLVRPTAILALVRAGRRDEAGALAAGGPRLRPCWSWAFSVVQWAEIVVELDLPGGEELHAQLLPMADELVVAGSNLACFGSVREWLGRLTVHLGDREAGLAHLRAAVERDERLGLPLPAARSRAVLAALA